MMTSMLRAALAAIVMVGAVTGAAAARDLYGRDAPFQLRDLPAKSQLRLDMETLSPQARRAALRRLHGFSFPAADVNLLRVDRRGAVFYADPVRRRADPDQNGSDLSGHRHGHREPSQARQALMKMVVQVDRAQVLRLHSKPDASRKIYLNFRGATVSGTAWNATSKKAQHVMKPYTEDSDFAGLSQNEANTIAEVWLRVAEDYAPFDVDVTTETPPKFGPQVAHVLISPRRDASGGFIYPSAAGGVAYVGVWGFSNFPYYQPALVFPEGVGSAKGIAEAVSHEVGHNLGLSHDGTASLGYYSGHGSGNVSWGPLMGVGYYTNVSQWSRGEYAGANNTQDDIGIIANNLPVRTDDHGGTADTATPLIVEGQQVVSSTPVIDPFRAQPDFNRGLIERVGDLDVFSVKVGSLGAVDLTVTPDWKDGFLAQSLRSANLDIKATLYVQDAASATPKLGAAVATSDPTNDTFARITATLPAARYYLVISGVGNGVPASGYSAYGSLGKYFIAGSLPPGSETTVPLSITVAGTGAGSVASSPSAIDCGATCQAEMPYKQVVTLTAVAEPGSQFVGWSGACSGASPICTVTLSASKATVATFRIVPIMHQVTVAKAGTGIGTIRSTPAGIDCGLVCTGSFEQGAVVTLTAVRGAQTSFVGWSGACSGTSLTCQVTVGGAASATATFLSTVKVPVIVARAGMGGGRVTSSPAGIDCGADCGLQMLLGTSLTLTATPANGSVFGYWTGGCTGTATTCTTTLAAAFNTTAVFNMAGGVVLTVRKAGTSGGTVVSAPVGLNCGSLCAAPFPKGVKVTLVATPDTGVQFKGWSGPCNGTATTCTVFLLSAQEVTATFSRR